MRSLRERPSCACDWRNFKPLLGSFYHRESLKNRSQRPEERQESRGSFKVAYSRLACLEYKYFLQFSRLLRCRLVHFSRGLLPFNAACKWKSFIGSFIWIFNFVYFTNDWCWYIRMGQSDSLEGIQESSRLEGTRKGTKSNPGERVETCGRHARSHRESDVAQPRGCFLSLSQRSQRLQKASKVSLKAWRQLRDSSNGSQRVHLANTRLVEHLTD